MSEHTLSGGAQRALEGARDEARRLGHDAIGAEHVLLGLLQNGGPAATVFGALGIETEAARERLAASGRRRRARAGSDTAVAEGSLEYTSHAKRIIESATREAHRQGSELLPEHLLAAALEDPRGGLARLLSDAGVAPGDARRVVQQRFGLPANAEADREPRREAEREPRRQAERESKREANREPRREPGAEPRREPRREQPRERADEARAEARSRRREVPDAPPARSESRPVAAHLQPRAKRKISWRELMLVAVPISLVLSWMHQSPILVFVFACLAVLPLAGYMGEATEHLAQKTGPTIGGLLNATFGNAAELIIAIVALRAGLVELVKASITGSILGNLLLILGLSIVAGGTRRSELRFNRTTAGMSSAMLALAVAGLLLPALFHAVHPEAAARASEMWMSEGVAGILIATYGFSLLFTLKTHRCLFGGDGHAVEGPVWSAGKAVLILALATIGVAMESEILVHATEAVTRSLHLSEVFLGLIVVPLIGNAAEHATAITVARKGQMDLSLQIALGSSTQIALLVGPLLVFIGLAVGQPMSLVFTSFEVVALGVSTLVVAILTHDGESHWFEGVQLLAVYAMLAVAAFFI